ncbi:MAG: hypothetical protein ACI35S_08910 [Anaeroplasma sp.]
MFQPYQTPKQFFYNGSKPLCRNNIRKDDDRGILLPFLVGAAVAFPIGYIASNTNKNNYQMPYYPVQYGYPAGYQMMPQYYPQYYPYYR